MYNFAFHFNYTQFMKAIILNEAGSVENLHFADIEMPSVQRDEVLVKLAAISINPVDVKARAYDGVLSWIFGDQRPVILGWDISGEVIKTGNEVDGFKPGDEVFGMINFLGNGKAYAEYVSCPASHLALKPSKLTHQEAAASTMAALTAYQALVDFAKIKKGDQVLIHAASGGVGHFAVQIAKYYGAYVIGTSSATNKDFVLSIGADEHLDYTKENLADRFQNLDIVLDTIGADTLYSSIDIIRPGGIVVTLPSPEISAKIKDKAADKQVKVESMMVASSGETMKILANLLENKHIRPHIYKDFSFAELGKAHLEVETNRVVGKVVVTI